MGKITKEEKVATHFMIYRRQFDIMEKMCYELKTTKVDIVRAALDDYIEKLGYAKEDIMTKL